MICPASSHARSVHRSWPYAFLMNLYRYSSTLNGFAVVKAQLLKKLLDAGFSEQFVKVLHLNSIFVEPYHSIAHRRRGPDACYGPRGERELSVWYVLPFHPAWAGSVGRALQDLNQNDFLQDAIRSMGSRAFTVRPAWKLSGKPWAQRLMCWR